MNMHIDLTSIPMISMRLHRDTIENDLCGEINFISTEKIQKQIYDVISDGRICDITYRLSALPDEDEFEEIVTKDCYITAFDLNDECCKLEYVTSNAGSRILTVFRTRDKKQIIVGDKVAKLVKKVCKPKRLSFKQLQKVVVACSI